MEVQNQIPNVSCIQEAKIWTTETILRARVDRHSDVKNWWTIMQHANTKVFLPQGVLIFPNSGFLLTEQEMMKKWWIEKKVNFVCSLVQICLLYLCCFFISKLIKCSILQVLGTDNTHSHKRKASSWLQVCTHFRNDRRRARKTL